MLRIELFGTPRVGTGERALPAIPSRRALSLFCFLIVHRGRVHDRAVLAGTFCGERPESIARKLLRSDLWKIRRALQAAGPEAERLLIVADHCVGFERSAGYWLDLEEFRVRLAAADRLLVAAPTAAAAQLDAAIRLYKGDLLEGIYDEWCVHEQTRLRALFLRALERALHLHASCGNVDRAIELGTRLLHEDPLRENIHRDLMRIYAESGNRPAALRQFQACAAALQRELAVAPMESTLTLQRAILEGRALPVTPAAAPSAPAASHGTESLLHDLRTAVAEARRAQSHLDAVLRRLEAAGIDHR